MNALLVVGDPATRQQIEEFFRSRNHEVVVQNDYEKALQAVTDGTFHFVLIELGKEGREAFELCRRLRLLPQTERLFILVLPEQDSIDSMRTALEAGADDYLVRPLSIATLQLRLAIGQRFVAARCKNTNLQRHLDQRDERYRIVAESLREGLLQVDTDGIIQLANSSVSMITGYSAQELIGKKADELLVEPAIRDRLAGGTLFGNGANVEEHAVALRTKEGEAVQVNWTTTSLKDLEGTGDGSLAVLQDITEQQQAEEALRHREEYFRVLWENTTDLITILDIEGRILYQSASSQPILGWRSIDLVGRDFFEFLHPDDRKAFSKKLQDSLESDGSTATAQLRFRHRKNDWRFLESMCNNLIENPVVGGIIVTSRDVTERRRVDAALKRERAFFQQLFRNSPVGIVILDSVDRVVDCNRSFSELFQYQLEELQGRPLNELIVPKHLLKEASDLSRTVFAKQTVEQDTTRKRKDGSVVEVSIVGYPIELADHRRGAFGLYTDISERKQIERKLVHDAFHDALTRLPNRILMIERLRRALHRANRQDRYQFALLFIDLDRFKEINDELGHSAGDEFLIETSRRLASCLRPGDMTARLGGDEFTILLDDLQQMSDATPIAERILVALSQPFTIGGQEVVSSGSIGIAFSSSGYTRAEDILRDADAAMYRAKNRGKACYEIFDPQLHQKAVARRQLESELGQAIQDSELTLLYQPILSLTTGQVTSFEALLSWQPNVERSLGVEEVIPLAEKTGQIVPLARWVFTQACHMMASWQGRLSQHSGLLLGIRFSSRDIFQLDFVRELKRIVEETGVNPSAISLQPAERLLPDIEDSVIEVAWELRKLGFRLYIDDFGAGFSSLPTLQKLPLEIIKLDGSFVRGLKPGTPASEVIRAATALAHSLGLQVIAKDIDNHTQAEQLRRLGVERVQGPLYSKPLTASEAEEKLDADVTWA